MPALPMGFWVIVMLMTAFVVFFILSDTFEDVKQLFVSSKQVIDIAYQPVSCDKSKNTYTLSAQVARPAFSKRTEVVPIFIYGKPVSTVSIGKPSKIILETEEQSTVPVQSDFTVVPAAGEQFIVVLISDDEKCKKLAESRATFEKFAAECGKFVQSLKSLTIEKNECVAEREQKQTCTSCTGKGNVWCTTAATSETDGVCKTSGSCTDQQPKYPTAVLLKSSCPSS